jgi:putative NIF3 family GTP cyclohydrolase 1 type 2
MMHIREDHITEAKKHHINVIVAGHMASDSIGMNHVLDGLEKKGIEIVPFAGLIRVSRNNGGKKKR